MRNRAPRARQPKIKFKLKIGQLTPAGDPFFFTGICDKLAEVQVYIKKWETGPGPQTWWYLHPQIWADDLRAQTCPVRPVTTDDIGFGVGFFTEWRLCLAEQRSLIYIIALNENWNLICRECIARRGGVEGAQKRVFWVT